jgi:GTP cyclohydrolase I
MMTSNIGVYNEAFEAVETLLRYVGEDPKREGLRDTPDRVLRAYDEMLSGYNKDPKDVIKTFEDGTCEEMVVVREIDFVSFCEHHWLPFSGRVHVGYLPAEKIVGLSKIPRLVDIFARRLQVQERMTAQIADSLQDHLKPKGCGVVVEAVHSCMSCRGVRKQNADMVTSALRGLFKTSELTKHEFLNFCRSR